MKLQNIPLSELRVGLYIRLDGDWADYPFMHRSFKIKTKKQIRIIQGLGMTSILYDPSRSDIQIEEPVLADVEEPVLVDIPEPEEVVAVPVIKQNFKEKKQRVEKLAERRVSLNRCKKEFSESVDKVKSLVAGLQARPKESIVAAEELVNDLVETTLVDQDSTLQLVNMKGQDEGSYFHIINVTMLSLIIGKEIGLSEVEMNHLGVGAMLHDLGMAKIPTKISRKTTAFTKVERAAYNLHPHYGAEMATKLGHLEEPVIQIIKQHHEYEDGTGYPKQLKSEQITRLSKIVVVATAYDDLCNCPRDTKLLSPFEAMSYMFQQTKFDKEILSIFINKLGIYPPGTLVKLSNGLVAGVTAVNHDDLLKPQVVVYDPEIPKEEALIIDLAEEDVVIENSIRRTEVSPRMLSYLNFGDSVNYFIDPTSS